MPSVTISNPNLQIEGPIVEVQFLVSKELEAKLREENTPIPASARVKALIDTGASNCSVQEDIPQKLGLQPYDKILISTPSGNAECYRYFMRMLIPTHNIIYEGMFTAVPGLIIQNIQCLIGRDLLSFSEFTYRGKQRQFTLTL